MQLNQILERYDHYLQVYTENLEYLDELPKTLLENSLFLALFTIFESYLKNLINLYIESQKGTIKFEDLTKRFAREYLSDKQKQFENFFKKGKDDSLENIKKIIHEPINEHDFKKLIQFHFLHKDKLENYYPDLFEQIFDNRNILNDLRLESKVESRILEERVSVEASKFLMKFTSEVRNEIAHKNSNFQITDYSFEDCVNNFKVIIKTLDKEFKFNKAKFNDLYPITNTVQPENILDQFNG